MTWFAPTSHHPGHHDCDGRARKPQSGWRGCAALGRGRRLQHSHAGACVLPAPRHHSHARTRRWGAWWTDKGGREGVA